MALARGAGSKEGGGNRTGTGPVLYGVGEGLHSTLVQYRRALETESINPLLHDGREGFPHSRKQTRKTQN